ncbi:hypothetical protein ACO1O0_002549 [Amphichorda felina]
MYAEAKDLEDSSVKIALDAGHLYSAEGVDKVKVFDILLIQVGPIENLNSDLDARDYFGFPVLSLTLSASREKFTTVENIRMGRFTVDPVVGTVGNFNIARSWLKECRESHPNCSLGQTPELPTRVIDIGPLDGSETPRVFLSEGMRAEYVTLSHCWGGKISPLLTGDTLSSFQVALPYSTLPANFKDAIRITRELGCRYVWIDSLCIIQDSKGDWQQESKKMAPYYSNSTLTICALASSGSTTGILNPPRNTPWNPKPTKLRVLSDGNQEFNVEVQRMDQEEETLRVLDMHSPLTARGWTLQESILSSRILFFGSQQIYWKCPGGFQAADGAPMPNRFPPYEYGGLSSVLHEKTSKQPPNRLDLLQEYYDLVVDYSQRNLSFDSDKFPAYSGLAQCLQPYIGGDYVAGIWTSDLKRGLLWYPEMSYCRHVQSYRAPSWSWAVTNGSICFGPESLPSSARGLQLVDHSVSPKDRSNPYGELYEAMLVVEGLMMPLVRSMQVILRSAMEDGVHIGYCWFDDPYSDEELKLGASSVSDIYLANEGDESYLLSTFYLLEDAPPDLAIDMSKYVEDSYFVILVHVHSDHSDENGKKSTYQRVGYINLNDRGLEWIHPDAWERKRVTLV